MAEQSTFSVVRQVLTLTLGLQVLLMSSSSSLALAATDASTTYAVPLVSTLHLNPTTFLAETNAARVQAGLSALTIDPELMQAAHAKAQDMVLNGYWDHFRPSDHKAPWDFIKEAGYTYTVAGENLARGYRTAHGITLAWLASPTHRANLLSPLYANVGFATVEGTDETGQPALFTVQLFGTK